MAKVKTKKKVAKKIAAKKYGIDELAKALGIKPATARIKLREAKVKKAGKGYGWDSPAEVQAVAKQLAA